MAEQLKVVATLKLKPESRELAIETLFKPLVEKTRKEEGVITYVLHNDVVDQNTFIFVEEYKNKQAIDSHMKSAHFLEFFGKIKEHLAGAPAINTIKPLL